MNILLTGAFGFIGHHLLPCLLEVGHNVVAYDLKPCAGLEPYSSKPAQVITGNLSLGEGLDQVAWEKMDAVIHLAAAGVKAYRRNWSECVAANIVGTTQLINAMSSISTPPLLVYPRTFYEAYLNDLPVFKENPYIVTKASGAKIIETWARCNKNARISIGTIFQIYGSGDDQGNVLSYTAKCLMDGLPAELGSGKGLRDWIYIKDVVDGFMKVLDVSADRIQHFDLGTGKLTSLKKMAEMLASLTGSSQNLLQFDPKRDRGDTELKACAENILPGWRANYSVEDGLAHFVKDVIRDRKLEKDSKN